ncbi:hypothetical protein HY604_00865 [Candidatus Peregrinibacteria bacterium]|nr:hypothetical protein [Candidatus Peregrinibacteria bacterium]
MAHFFNLLLILATLLVYSNLFTPGYLIFLHKHKNTLENFEKLFFAFALSISSIFLLLIFPKFAFNNYNISLLFLGVAFIFNLIYIFTNKKLLKSLFQNVITTLKEHKTLFFIFFATILLIIIPALHYPWYYGYGIDWGHHVGLVKSTIIGKGETFYPALGVHAFLSILQLLNFTYPEIFQISTAYLIAISILPFYFIAKSLLDKKGLIAALLLFPILPYHHFMYGEYIPNASATFFYLSFFLIIFELFKNQLREKPQKETFLVLAGSLFLTVAIYNHQVFLYPFFYIFALLTIFFIFSLKQSSKIPWLFFTYLKILIITSILSFPFLHKLYSGTKEVLALHKTDAVYYDFGSFLNSLVSNIGIIISIAGAIGIMFYVRHQYKKSNQKISRLNAGVMGALLFGVILAINIYFDQNPFWSQRSFYLLEIFITLPLAYLISYILEKYPWKILKIGFLIVFTIIASAKIDYAFNIDAVWSEEIQSSVDWVKENKKNMRDKEIYIVFNEVGGATEIFFLAINEMAQTPVKRLSKAEFTARPEIPQDSEILNNNFYRIVQNGNRIYIAYKVEVLYSYDALNFRKPVDTRPERTYVLDKILRRHFFIFETDQQSSRISGYGIAIGNGRKAGQSFIPSNDSLDKICVNLSKSKPDTDPLHLELYRLGETKPIKIVTLSERKTDIVPINNYSEFCFPVNEKVTAGQQYVFYITTDAAEPYYAVLNAGISGYSLGTAYDNGGAVVDNLLFSTRTFHFFRW